MRIIGLRNDIEIFLRDKKQVLADRFKDKYTLAKFFYLSDLLSHLNELDLNMQGRNQTIVDVVGSRGEKSRKNTSKGNISSFRR